MFLAETFQAHSRCFLTVLTVCYDFDSTQSNHLLVSFQSFFDHKTWLYLYYTTVFITIQKYLKSKYIRKITLCTTGGTQHLKHKWFKNILLESFTGTVLELLRP